MSLKVTIDQTATQLHPTALSEAQTHKIADTAHPHAYCQQDVGFHGSMKVINVSAGGPVCPKGFSLLGYVSDATRAKMLSSGAGEHASAAADRMVQGGLNVQKAGVGSAGVMFVGGFIGMAVGAAIGSPVMLIGGIVVLGFGLVGALIGIE